MTVLLAAAPALAAYDVNGVALGAREADVKKAFPSAHCKPLEWRSRAADRRCDDARIAFAGVRGRLTVYLRRDTVEAFTVRFDARERDKVVAQLKSRWGTPTGEANETIGRKDKADRKIHKLRWENGNERALLTAQLDRKRATLEAWRGNFAEEIYQVR